MTARDIQRRLCHDRFREAFVVPNYTPARWWECDVFEVSKAGYFREYEVKVTMKDFRADAEKAEERMRFVDEPAGRRWEKRVIGNKHELLGDPWRAFISGWNVPVSFVFVVPEDIAAGVRAELPSFAGLVVASPGGVSKPPYNVRLREVVKPPRLHNNELPGAVAEHAKSVLYYRMHSLFIRSTF